MELPEISGLEVVCRIRKDPLYSDLVIVGLGTEDGTGTQKVALVAGCTGFITYPLDPKSFSTRISNYLEGEREELDLKEHLQYYRLFSEVLIEKLETRLASLEKKTVALEGERERQKNLTFQILTSLAKLIEAKDHYTRGHSDRVTRYSVHLAKAAGLVGEDLKTLERASLLHDIGKIAIDLKQIHKPGPLNKEEWELIQQHPNIGYEILSPIDFLRDEALIVKFHHYRFEDFEAHPHIPRRIRIMASILTLVDAYDAMTSQRSYNRPRDLDDAMSELRRCAGSQFDPELTKAFLRLLQLERQEEAKGDGTGVQESVTPAS
jgi:putative nucleotidyltransferase with HDIG domain